MMSPLITLGTDLLTKTYFLLEQVFRVNVQGIFLLAESETTS